MLSNKIVCEYICTSVHSGVVHAARDGGEEVDREGKVRVLGMVRGESVQGGVKLKSVNRGEEWERG
jgi:hypothetical protein